MDLKFDSYDKKAEVDGVWRTLDEESEKPAQFLIARSGNDKFRAEVERLTDELRQQGKLTEDGVTMEQAQEIFARAASRFILLDWRNVSEDGDPISCTPENAYRVLTDPALSDLRNQIVLWAQESQEYKVRSVQELGND